MEPDYYIGLTQWSHPGWADSVLNRARAGVSDLSVYARSFSSVEGNTTFYGLPSAQAVQRWAEETAADFRFCFKFPQEISHRRALQDVQTPLLEFVRRIAPLEGRLGVLWLQLPAQFGPERLPLLAQFLQQLPAGFAYGVEVRHPAFCVPGTADRGLNELLAASGINRVSFDTRILFANPSGDAATREALQQKPNLPLRVAATGRSPMIRFIAPLDLTLARPTLEEWAERVSRWVGQGRRPYLFLHTPDNRLSPELGAEFAALLAARGLRGGFNAWPPPLQEQAGLF